MAQDSSCVRISHVIHACSERFSSTFSSPFHPISSSSHSLSISCTFSCTSSTTLRAVVTLSTLPKKRWSLMTNSTSSQRMKRLQCTSAVLSLGKLCDEHGNSYEWINGQKPHLIKNGIRIQCNTENFVPIVVPGLLTSSSSSLPSSTSMTPSRQEIDHPTSSLSSSTSPTMTSSTVSSESVARQKWRGQCGIDRFRAAVSSKHVERQERGDPCC